MIFEACHLRLHLRVKIVSLVGILLPYPPDNLVLDVVLMLLFLGLETLRIFYGETFIIKIMSAAVRQ